MVKSAGGRLKSVRKELKALSLRPIKVSNENKRSFNIGLSSIFWQSAFWELGNSDPHSALSYDRLHFFEGGVVHHFLDAIFDNFSSNKETLTTIDDW